MIDVVILWAEKLEPLATEKTHLLVIASENHTQVGDTGLVVRPYKWFTKLEIWLESVSSRFVITNDLCFFLNH